MVNGRSLTILSNKLKPGTRYLLSVNMSVDNSVNNYVKYGPAYYTFTTNLPPEGGHCKIIPYDSKLLPIADEELVNTTVNPRECVYNNKSGYRGNNRLSNVFFYNVFFGVCFPGNELLEDFVVTYCITSIYAFVIHTVYIFNLYN